MIVSNTSLDTRYVGVVTAEHDNEAKLTVENAIYRHGKVFSEYLAKGLADNWSQVC